MYIIQISDLHISPTINIAVLKNKVRKLLPVIRSEVPANSHVICCLLGDFYKTYKVSAIHVTAGYIQRFGFGASPISIFA